MFTLRVIIRYLLIYYPTPLFAVNSLYERERGRKEENAKKRPVGVMIHLLLPLNDAMVLIFDGSSEYSVHTREINHFNLFRAFIYIKVQRPLNIFQREIFSSNRLQR